MTEVIDKAVEKKLVAISTDVDEQKKTAIKLAIITDEKDVANATQFLGLIKGRLKRIKDVKDEIVKPLKDHVKFLESRFKEQELPLLEMENNVKSGMSQYAREQEAIALKKEEKERAKQLKKEEKAKASGKSVDIVPVATVERRQPTMKTEAGSATTKKVWKYEILDVHALPKKYKDAILEKALERDIAGVIINGAVKGGAREIKGVKIFEDFEVSVRL